MKNIKITSLLLVIFAMVSALYLYGCSSAQSTTGKLAFKEKDYVKAEAELKKGLEIDKNDAEGWYMLGHSQIELGKYGEAQESFKKSRAINNNYSNEISALWIDKFNAGVTSYNAGINSVKTGDSAAASRNFRTALNNLFAASSINSDSVKVAQLMGDAYFYMGKKDSALTYYTSIIDKSKSPEDATQIARILYESGLDAMNNKDYTRAMETFGRIYTLTYLPKDNKYYEVATYNTALANYRIVEGLAADNKPSSEYDPYLRQIVTILEPFVSTSKNNDLLKDSYDLLIVSYDALEMPDKAADARTKKAALGGD